MLHKTWVTILLLVTHVLLDSHIVYNNLYLIVIEAWPRHEIRPNRKYVKYILFGLMIESLKIPPPPFITANFRGCGL